MPNTQTFPTHKIILCVFLICAAIITLLFVFHLRKSPMQLHLSPEIGILFPARDIKPFELITANHGTFKLNDFYHHWTLLFFGFTHCSSVCPITLTTLSQAYTKLQPHYPNLQVVFVSLDPERDSVETLAKYTRSYHPHFIGATGSTQTLRKLQSQLGIYSARDPSSSNNDYQLQHSSSVLFINPQGKWVGLFKYGLKPNQLIQGVQDSIK